MALDPWMASRRRNSVPRTTVHCAKCWWWRHCGLAKVRSLGNAVPVNREDIHIYIYMCKYAYMYVYIVIYLSPQRARNSCPMLVLDCFAWLLNNCSCLHVSISTCPIPPLFARIRSWCTTSLAPRSLFEFGSQTLRFNLRICCWYSPKIFWVQRRAHDSAWVPLDLAIWEARPTKSSSCQQA